MTSSASAASDSTGAPDDILLRAIARDLDGHFGELLTCYQGSVYGLALRLAMVPQDAEEIAQDTFLRAYHALAGYPPERILALRVRPWLHQITLNVFRNRVRARRVTQQPLDTLDATSALLADDEAARPERIAERAERADELVSILGSLPVPWRVAVVLRHVEGYTYSEIATMLGQPEGTVKSNVHRGTLRLREELLALAARLEVAP